MARQFSEHSKTLSNEEKRMIDKGLRLLRDRHFRNYSASSKPNGDVAQTQKLIAESLDQLRGKIFDL